MKGDFTRSTWKPEKHYSGVRMQQGRVQLDADWNEQVDIEAHLREASLGDLVGSCGAPLHGGGFKVGLSADAADLTLSAGRLYAAGILCELGPPDATYTTQLAGLDPALAAGFKPPLPPATGSYFVYADVWQRHLTALEDPAIRETALGGPDTATRTQAFWQVKLLLVDAGSHCLSTPQAWLDATGSPSGMLRARTHPGDPPAGPCIVPASAGYTRLENQLYRVEVHQGGALGAGATFKWSRDDGSVVAPWLALDGADPQKPKLTVGHSGRDTVSGFIPGAWVEVTDDAHEVTGRPGQLAKLLDVQGDVLTLDLSAGPVLALADYPVNPKVRGWDSAGDAGIVQPAGTDGYLPLESGVEVRFEAGSYRTGDYWLIPARAFIGIFSGDIEWPRDGGGNPLAAPPAGVAHHACKLAVVDFDAAPKKFANVRDCRLLFPAATELIHLFHVGGDGQEALPGQALACPLEVGVTNGQWPVAGARVEFKVAAGAGTISPPPPPVQPALSATAANATKATARAAAVTAGTAAEGAAGAAGLTAGTAAAGAAGAAALLTDLVVVTGDDGVARCLWTLPGIDGAPSCLTVTATLRDVAGNPVSIPVVFHAGLSLAREVAYEPGACDLLSQASTVQQALDILCKSLRQPGIVIEKVSTGDGKDLANDTDVNVGRLLQGLAMICDQDVATALFTPQPPQLPTPARPNVQVLLYLPYPIGGDITFWDFSGIVGFQPLLLAGTTTAQGATIGWKPSNLCAGWLSKILFLQLSTKKVTNRLLVQIVVKGNFVWSAKDASLFLDGDAFGRLVESTIGLALPSGNGQRGGDFESWFWLVPDQTLTVSVSGQAVAGFLRDAQGAGIANAKISILPATGAAPATGALTTVTAAAGDFRFTPVPVGQLTVQAEVPGGPVLTQAITVTPIVVVNPGVGTPVTAAPGIVAPAAPAPAAPSAVTPAAVTPGAVTPAAVTSAAVAPAATPAPQLTDVSGIGPARSRLLMAAGIKTPADLAAADPTKVAVALKVTEGKAKELISSARKPA